MNKTVIASVTAAVLIGGALTLPVRAQQPSTPLTFKYENADVREVLRQVFLRSGVSYSLAPDIQGTVTLDLREVGFETALRNVLRQVDGTYLIEGGVFHVVRNSVTVSPPVQPVDPATPMPMSPPGNWSSAPPIVTQDNKHLYLISSGKIVKIRKSDLKVEQERAIPVQWGNVPQFGGS